MKKIALILLILFMVVSISKTLNAGGSNDIPKINGMGDLTWNNMTKTGEISYERIKYLGNRFVIVGDSGCISISSDGIKWDQVNCGTLEKFNAVAYGNGYYVIIGNNGRILRTIDFIRWETTNNYSMYDFSDIVWNGKAFFAIGNNKGQSIILTSKDGLNWTINKFFLLKNLYAVATNNKATAIIYSNNISGKYFIMTSSDGKDWKDVTISNNLSIDYLKSIIWTGENFIAVGNTSGYLAKVLFSKDGSVWTCYEGKNCLIDSYNIGYGNKTYVGVGYAGIFFSKKGTDWTKAKSNLNLMGITFGQGKFIAIGDNETIASSLDGIKWTICNQHSNSTSFNAVASNIKVSVCVGNNEKGEGIIYTSSDNKHWNLAFAATSRFEDVKWDGEKFIALGRDGSLYLSYDGNEWQLAYDEYSMDARHLCAERGHYAVIGYFKGILISNDGLNWRLTENVDTDKILYSAATNGKIYVVVGTDGEIMTSANGESWKHQKSGIKNDIYDVYWDGNRFMATGLDVLLTSKDGINWEKRGMFEGIQKIIWNGMQYIGIGAYKSQIFCSDEGINWQKVSPELCKFNISDILYSNGTFITVGNDIYVGEKRMN